MRVSENSFHFLPEVLVRQPFTTIFSPFKTCPDKARFEFSVMRISEVGRAAGQGGGQIVAGSGPKCGREVSRHFRALSAIR
jgi:hypothetical protein